MQIEISKIRPSPFQPRLEFDLEDLKGPIIRDGIVDHLIVRQIDDYYELIDGERRWRIAQDLGYETVPCDIIEADDEKTDRLVWRVNTLRKDYRPKEKALHYKMHYDNGMAIQEIAENHGSRWNTVQACINSLKLPEKYQEAVWSGPLSLRHIEMVESLFNSTTVESILSYLDDAIERKLTHIQLAEIVDPVKAEIKKQQIEAAKKEAKTIKPEIQVKMETPEDYEKAAGTLKQEAKKRREVELTPEQKMGIEAKKQREKEDKERKRKEKEEKEEARIQEEAERRAKEKLIKDEKFREEVKADLSQSDIKGLKEVEADSGLTKADKENIREGIASGRIRGEKQIKEEVQWIKIQKIDEAKKDEKREKSRELESFLKRIQEVSIELRNKLNTLRRQFQVYPETIKYLPQPQASRTAEALNLLIFVMTELQKTLEGKKWQKNKEMKQLSKEEMRKGENL